MDVCTAADEGNAHKYLVLGPAGTKELELAKVARWDEQNFSTKLLVGFRRKPQTGVFGPDRVHEARWETCDKKACFCSPGRNLKNRAMECSKVSGLPLSRLAPARKSAQIISKQ